MRSSNATPILACINQKGGVGKSTLTTLLANIFYFQKGLQVAIIDADFPQHTIYKRRIENADYIRQSPSQTLLSQTLYKNRLPIQVINIAIDQVEQTITTIQDQFDCIFLDIAGTLNQEGIQKALGLVHHFFIPVLQDRDTFKSSMEFFQVATEHIFPNSTVFKNCFFLLNNLPHKNKEAVYRTAIEKEGGQLLRNNMYHHVVYERLFRSTLLPIPKASPVAAVEKPYDRAIMKLDAFAQEVFEICFGDAVESKATASSDAAVNAHSNIKVEEDAPLLT